MDTTIIKRKVLKPENVKKNKSRLIKHKAFLDLLYSADEDQRKQLIDIAKKDQILAICECAYNTVHENVKLSPKDIKKLKRSKDILCDICNPHIPVEEKKDILIQKGGLAFIPALLAPILGGLLGAAVSR